MHCTQSAERGFWFNNVTGESTWKYPEALGIKASNTDRVYYIVDGSPTWEPPEAYAWRAVPDTSAEGAAEGRVYFENTVSHEVTWTRPAALGWSRRSVSKTFWYNAVTGETRRDAPTDVVGFEHPSGSRYFVAAAAGGDGSAAEATWERPAAAWTEVQSEEHGQPYFHTNVTGEVVWERPAHSNVAWQLYHEEL